MFRGLHKEQDPPVQKSRFMFIAGIAMVLSIGPLLLTRTSPSVRKVRRIQEQYFVAERPVLRPGSATRDAEKFLSDLKAIDTEGAPQPVRDAFTKMLAAVESNLAVRRAGGDTNKANDAVTDAMRELKGQFDRHRGNPY